MARINNEEEIQLVLNQNQREKSLFLDLTPHVLPKKNFLLKVVSPAISVPLIMDVRRKKGLKQGQSKTSHRWFTEEPTHQCGLILAFSV